MAKKKQEKSELLISKSKSYGKEHFIKLGLDKEREKKFNKGEKIPVTEEELNAIGKHRWLEV